ncbi:hypothetical protein [Ornithinimicrobium kibberense]|uniref:hypothetical protein n=1 Tax=Ornithinimicrobium kibberense TaxID=282060 RepID=UPI00360D1263
MGGVLVGEVRTKAGDHRTGCVQALRAHRVSHVLALCGASAGDCFLSDARPGPTGASGQPSPQCVGGGAGPGLPHLPRAGAAARGGRPAGPAAGGGDKGG